jgi:hypothetical protein
MRKFIKVCLKNGENFFLKENEDITFEKIHNDLIFNSPTWFSQVDEDGNRYIFHSSEIEYIKEFSIEE